MPHLSRRKLLGGIGSLLGASLAPVCGLASPAASPLPELEDIFGAKRLAKLKALYRAGKPVADFTALDLLFDADGRFRVSRNFREGITRFLCFGTPVEIVVLDEYVSTEREWKVWQPDLDMDVAEIIGRAGLFWPGTAYGVPWDDPPRLCYWRNEDWRAAGWAPPTDASWWVDPPGHIRKPVPELAA